MDQAINPSKTRFSERVEFSLNPLGLNIQCNPRRCSNAPQRKHFMSMGQNFIQKMTSDKPRCTRDSDPH
jgi:hypothetical protein